MGKLSPREALQTILAAHAGLGALVSSRIYSKSAPQDAIRPYIVYHQITNIPVNAMGGRTDLVRPYFQVNIWADSNAILNDVAKQVDAALADYKGTVIDGTDSLTVQWVEFKDEHDFQDEKDEQTDTLLMGRALDYKMWAGG